MADKVQFDLVSPERLLRSEAVDMVVVPGTEGDFGVLPGHAPVISTVRPGVLEIFQGGAVADRIFIAGGIAEVSNDRCTVLADEAMPVAELDRPKLDARLKEAEERLTAAKTDAEQYMANASIAILRELIAVAR